MQIFVLFRLTVVVGMAYSTPASFEIKQPTDTYGPLLTPSGFNPNLLRYEFMSPQEPTEIFGWMNTPPEFYPPLPHVLRKHKPTGKTAGGKFIITPGYPVLSTTQKVTHHSPWNDSTVQPSDAQFATFVKKENGRFLMKICIQHFEAKNILVIVRDGFLVVNARHDEKLDHTGYVSRQFCRRYKIDDVEAGTVKFQVCMDGVLKITGLLKPPPVKDAREVPIVFTGPMLDEDEYEDENEDWHRHV